MIIFLLYSKFDINAYNYTAIRYHTFTTTTITGAALVVKVTMTIVYEPVSGTSVGLMIRRICSIECRSGERPP